MFTPSISSATARTNIGSRSSRALPATNVSFFSPGLVQRLAARDQRFFTVICLKLLARVRARCSASGDPLRAQAAWDRAPIRGELGTSWKRRLDRSALFSYSDLDHKIEPTLEGVRGRAREERLPRRASPSVRLRHLAHRGIDLVGGVSLPLYRRLTNMRHRLARRYPEENAGFFAVCKTT